MAAVYGIGRFAWRIRALVVEKGFVINVLQRLKTPVRMHVQKRVRFKSEQIKIQRRSVLLSFEEILPPAVNLDLTSINFVYLSFLVRGS